ncbi:MAG TPA: glutamyl-tRNA reductase [Pirellulaceae bacterium]
MSLWMLGCSHRDCGLDLRERLAVPRERLPRYLRDFRTRFPESEVVLLSTCNRTELYTAAPRPDAAPSREEAVSFLATQHGVRHQELGRTLAYRRGGEAIRHLFSVAASLDSLVLGETQILSQVKRAYAAARELESAGRLTHAAFQAAIRVGRRVARETDLHRHSISIPVLAVRDCAKQVFERLDDKRILLLGAGEMAVETLHCLRSEGARRITLVHRDLAKARALAERFGAQVQPWEHRVAHLCESDLVVSATGSSHPIVDFSAFRAADHVRQQRTLLILDLGVPRDFQPAIGEALGVYLFSIDDLRETAEAHRRLRASELPQAERIVEEEAQRLLAGLDHQDAVPRIQELSRTVESLRTTELTRLFHRLPELSPTQRLEIERTLERFSGKLVHPCLVALRSHRAEANRECHGRNPPGEISAEP